MQPYYKVKKVICDDMWYVQGFQPLWDVCGFETWVQGEADRESETDRISAALCGTKHVLKKRSPRRRGYMSRGDMQAAVSVETLPVSVTTFQTPTRHGTVAKIEARFANTRCSQLVNQRGPKTTVMSL